MQSSSYSFHILILSTDFQKKKPSDIKFHEHPSGGARFVPYGQTNRHNEANSRIRTVTNAPKDV
jgi:hypothetical protein